MNALLLTLVLAAPEPAAVTLTTDSMSDVAEAINADLRTGTLLFCKGDCLAVKFFTRSPYTHVAAVVMKDGRPVVYDSMNGVGTRSMPLGDWLDTQRPAEIFVYSPIEAYSDERANLLRTALDERLGRPYGNKHHLTGKRAEGMHCSEYVTDALIDAKLIKANSPPRVSPASLREGLVNTELYAATKSLELIPPEPPAEVATGRCSQLWISTKTCTLKSCRKLKSWFCCQ
jgi:hypothetical protein